MGEGEGRLVSACLEISRLTKSFTGTNGPAVVVKGFDLSIEREEFVSIIGHSGCGKSTVLSMVAGLLEPTSGGMVLDGKEILGPGLDRGVVFQSPCLLPWLTVLENVLLAVDQVLPSAGREERIHVAIQHLELVGLGGLHDRKPADLSAGMRQRVGIARAFALSPKLLLLDEPFGMLDSITRSELQDVLLRLWSQDRKTALLITHDVDEALLLSDRIVMMTSGPEARVGDILDVEFERPRDRLEILEHPDYPFLRDRLVGFLEGQSCPGRVPAGGALP